jgi:hypothetical protein
MSFYLKKIVKIGGLVFAVTGFVFYYYVNKKFHKQIIKINLDRK